MNIKILEQKKQPLLSRTEVTAEVTFEGTKTPSKSEVKKNIAAQTKSDEKLAVVKSIYNHSGSTIAQAVVYVYVSADEMKRIEPRDKKAQEAEKKAAEEKKAAAEAKEEKSE